jgi:phage tail-like protein
MVSSKIFDYLPLYAKLLDDAGILEHFADALQPQFDEVLQVLDLREPYFAANTCPSEWIHWVAQFAGLANVGTDWIGIGINPDWPDDHKREVINRAAAYYARKGAEWGLREAYALWLQWEDAHSERLTIHLPFGKIPTATPPNWWDYYTQYDAHLNQSWPERQFFGAGDYPHSYTPDWFTLEGYSIQQYGIDQWSDRTLQAIPAPETYCNGSGLGGQRPWINCYPLEKDWNNIFPNIIKLNYEALNTFAEPEIFGWLSYKLLAPVNLYLDEQDGFIIEERLHYDGFKYGDIWHYNAGETYTHTETELITEELEILPGHSFGDTWTSPDFPCPYNSLYAVPYRSYTLPIETEVIETIGCTPGFSGEVQVGVEEQEVGSFPAISPNQEMDRIPAIDLSIDNLGIPAINLRGDPVIEAPVISIAEISAIELPSAIGLDGLSLDTREARRDTTMSAQPPLISIADIPPIVLEQPVSFEFVEPLTVHHFDSAWGESGVYYSPGRDAIPGQIEEVPIIDIAQYCNYVDRYSLRIIEREIIRTPITPDPSRNLSESYPFLKTLGNAANWHLMLEAGEGLYMLRPSTIFWSNVVGAGKPDQRSQQITSDTKSLYLEFLVNSTSDTKLKSAAIILKGQSKVMHTLEDPALLSKSCHVGIKVIIPIAFNQESNQLGMQQNWVLVEA